MASSICQSFQITVIEFLYFNLFMDIAISSLSLILVSSFPTLISGIYLFYQLSSKNILTRTSLSWTGFSSNCSIPIKKNILGLSIFYCTFLLLHWFAIIFTIICILHIWNLFYSIIYLFLATLSLHCGTWDFSSCNEWEPLSSSGARGSHFAMASPVAEHRL